MIRSMDDTNARRDWGWHHQYDLKATVAGMTFDFYSIPFVISSE